MTVTTILTPVLRAVQRLDHGLRGGVRLLHQHGGHYQMSSASTPEQSYDVFSSIHEHIRTEACPCAYGARCGDVITYNVGTRAQRSAALHQVPCQHILVLRWWALSVPDREDLAGRFPILRPWIYWGHEALALPRLLERAQAWQARQEAVR